MNKSITTIFKLTANLPTVTSLSPVFLENFSTYLTPVPDISVNEPDKGARSKLLSPSSLAYPFPSAETFSFLSVTTKAANYNIMFI